MQKVLLKKYYVHDSVHVQDKQMFLKRVILWYGMVCYAMVWYGMVWKVWYAMRFQCYAMRFLCYAMVFVVKDKHSATVFDITKKFELNFRPLTRFSSYIFTFLIIFPYQLYYMSETINLQ